MKNQQTWQLHPAEQHLNMAHITEIKIDGLLGRSDTIHIKLHRGVNIFFGENGSGKTTLLKILDSAMSMNGSAMQALPVRRAEVYIFSITENRIIKHTWDRKNSTNSEISHLSAGVDWENFPSEDRVQFLKMSSSNSEWRLSPPLNKSEKITRWSHTFLPTTRLYLNEATRLTTAKQVNEGQFDTIFAENVNRSWLVYYSQVLTKVRQIQEEGLRAVLNNALAPKGNSETHSVLNPEDAYGRVSKFLRRQSTGDVNFLGTKASFVKRYQSEENLRKVVDNVDTIERQIEQAMVPISQFLLTIENLFSRGKTVSTVNNQLQINLQDGTIISPAQLSSGEKHILKILLAAMTGGVSSVIVDEPELSMHIDWQRIFVKTVFALNPECQLILASHSPEIMADIDDENIFRI
jgi:predicted ATP-dependent endonuclease of OLD family